MGTIRALAVLLLLGGAAAAQEHPQDAVIASYSQALASWPAGGAAKEKAVLYYNRGVAYSAKGDLAAAVSDYGAALELDPGNFDSHYNRGVAYHKLKRLDAALADLDQAVALRPGEAQAWLSRGVVRHERGDLEAAVADYDRAAALAPEVRALQYKGSALQELAERKAAQSAPAAAPAAPAAPVGPASQEKAGGWTLERVQALPLQAKAGAAAAVLALASLLAGIIRPKGPPPLSPAEAALAAFEEKGTLDPGDYPLVVSALKALGKLSLLENAAIPAEHRIAVAEALMDAGEEAAGLASLSKEGGTPWGKAEFACALRLCQRLDDFSAAEGYFQKIGLSPQLAPREAGELAYQFAVFCERKGQVDRAKAIHLDLIGRFGRFKDTARRLANLEAAGRGAPLAGDPGAAGLIAGKFELRETLGVGGMGVVYKAFDRSLSREVAVKRMRREITGDEASRRRFLEEARTVATLSHPNIVAIHEIAVTAGDVFLVFEFVLGETLWEILNARGPFPPAECARILRGTAEALEAAHAQNIIHRDLKPLNVMRDRRGLVKVMDFGIAGHGVASSDDPGAALVCGTPGYMAPEQYRGLCSPRSDLFALGVTAYELLTGELPFPGPDHLGQITTGFYADLPAAVPAKLRRLVAACLRADEKSRPAGAGDFLKEL